MAYWNSAIPELAGEGWQQTLAAQAIAVVHFWVGWSQPDLAMSKVIEQVRPEFAPITFFYVDTAGDGDELARMLEAHQTPVLICFLNGELHKKHIGYLLPDALRAKLNEWLAAST